MSNVYYNIKLIVHFCAIIHVRADNVLTSDLLSHTLLVLNKFKNGL